MDSKWNFGSFLRREISYRLDPISTYFTGNKHGKIRPKFGQRIANCVKIVFFSNISKIIDPIELGVASFVSFSGFSYDKPISGMKNLKIDF